MIADNTKIRSVVARFFNVPEATVTENFVFPPERLNASIGRATFHAALKRMAGADLPAAFTAKSFGELLGSSGGAVTPVEAAFVSPTTPEAGPAVAEENLSVDSGVGIDIEAYDNLPTTADFWTNSFYVENFTAAEIAYCQRQPDARASFCGLWCAKEAVRKCSSEFFTLRPIELEIQHDTRGRPFLSLSREGRRAKLSACKLSISHAHGMGTAVCVVQAGISAKLENAPALQQGPTFSSRLIWFGVGLGILNLILWLFFAVKK